ncbi:MAG: META domain-containing protein [Pseudomonadota bacterium]|nr:META domain-containing protein [Gammaproteobacteria bacterium]MDQ3583679.1 META domain-containing protein [Pseudomonadota bacterium]
MPLALGLMVVTGTAALGEDGTLPPAHSAERSSDVEPGRKCGGNMSTAEIENTYWKLTRLGEQAVMVAERQGEPHLVLRAESHQANGSGGCNRLFGGYRLEGGRISFSGIATTRMSCPAGMEIEGAFLRALAEAETWKISGPDLDLFDGGGEPVARFAAPSPECAR